MSSRSSPRFTPARYRGPLCLLLSKKYQRTVTACSARPCGCLKRAAAAGLHSTTSKASGYPPTASYSTISSLLTLFSKFFSSFLRSTCSLSVSHKYLALEEVYLPFRAAVPNNPTLRDHCYGRTSATYGAVTLFGVLFQGTYTGADAFAVGRLDYNSDALCAGFPI